MTCPLCGTWKEAVAVHHRNGPHEVPENMTPRERQIADEVENHPQGGLWVGCRTPRELELPYWHADKTQSIHAPWTAADFDGTFRRQRTLRGPMRDKVATAIYALAIDAEGPGLVAHRLLEAGIMGDHSSTGNPIAVYILRHGGHDPLVSPGWIAFGYFPGRFVMDLPPVIDAFLHDFDGWRYPKLDAFRAGRRTRGRDRPWVERPSKEHDDR